MSLRGIRMFDYYLLLSSGNLESKSRQKLCRKYLNKFLDRACLLCTKEFSRAQGI